MRRSMRISGLFTSLDIVAAAAVLFALLGGCAPQYAKTEDLFKKLDSNTDRPYASAKLCLLLTENTSQALLYVDRFHDHGYSQQDAKGLATDLTQIFGTRFRETVRVGSLDEVRAKQCNIGLVLDLKLEIAWGAFQSNLVAIDAAVTDDKGSQIDAISVSGKRMTMMANTGFSAVWKEALAAFEKNLDSSPKLMQYIAGLPKFEPAVASPPVAVAPAAIDLAFWDSIKNSKNPADFQAYLQKFPNGSFANLARIRLTALGEAVPVRLTPLALPADSKINFGSYHALVIGINNYKGVTQLKTAVGDAKTVADLLQKEYGFKVTLLLDATRNQMLDAFDELRRTLVETDNLLVYYAGHGHLDTDSDRGFWLPVDADANRRANWLSNSDIADMVRATRAKHVLLVADSCYAGTLTRNVTVELSALDDFARLAQKRARTALVSGGLEPVADSGGGGHSVFAKAFLDALLANNGVVDMSQIFSSMRRQVILTAQQTPQYGDIRQTGHEGGDFIFVRRTK